MMLTPDLLLSLFDYDPATGELIRLHATRGYPPGRRITRVNDKGYVLTTVNGKTHRVHHIVWVLFNGPFEGEIDHINRIRSDNRIQNLRLCDRRQNCGNTDPRVREYKGVTFCKQTQKWRAQIGIDYKNIPLGRFPTIEEAAAAYNEAASKYFGEFAVLNEL